MKLLGLFLLLLPFICFSIWAINDAGIELYLRFLRGLAMIILGIGGTAGCLLIGVFLLVGNKL